MHSITSTAIIKPCHRVGALTLTPRICFLVVKDTL
jgi:hypothetical protein